VIHDNAVALLTQGKAAEAKALLLAHPDTSPDQEFLLGACSHALNDIRAALQHFTAALKLNAQHAQSAAALSTLYDHLGRPDLAEQLLRQVLQQVDDVQLRFNLAAVQEKLQREDEAQRLYTQLLQQHPEHFAARLNRAGLYARKMQLREAAADYRELIKQHPQQTLPWQNLADIEISFGHYRDAISLLQEVLKREPGNAKAVQSLAIAHAVEADFIESRAAFEKLKVLDPAMWEAARQRVDGDAGHSTEIDPRLIYLIRQHEHLEVCQWSDWPRLIEVWHDMLRQPGAGMLKPLSFRSMLMPVGLAGQRELSRAIDRQYPQQRFREWTPTPTPARLRIAYMSADFRQHATGLLTRHFFAAHDRHAVEVILICLAPSDGSATARDILQSADRILDVSALDDAQALAAIAGLDLDILIDFNGYTTGARPQLLTQKPARILVHWLIMTCTTGAAAMDYYISDAAVSPGGDWCTEAEVQLPESYFVFSHGDVPTAPARAALGLPEKGFVFCCLNASQKIDPDTFSLWMDLLRETPDSVLWLLGSHSATVMNLKREAEWRGIDPRRLLFAPRVDSEAHLARMAAADIFLDTRYYNAHTTAAEALWAGLPVLTCPGEQYASRVGKSLVLSCGLPELVAGNWNEYRAIALRAARDREWLQGLRERLAVNRHTAAIFDVKRQARDLERAYREMRERFALGLKPAGFKVADLRG
jgi:predicted O-linked N-acetylglucosamine transferase (SPINDLY family)